jgi:hypothetical protein
MPKGSRTRLKIMVSPVRIRVPPLLKVVQIVENERALVSLSEPFVNSLLRECHFWRVWGGFLHTVCGMGIGSRLQRFERRMRFNVRAAVAQLGRHLVALIRPWANCGRVVALDSTVLRARGGVWHKKEREAAKVPHTSIDTEAHWTKSGWHGWVYGWKL